MFGRQKVKTVEGLPNLMYKRNKRKKHVWRAKSKMILSCQPQWVEPGCEKMYKGKEKDMFGRQKNS